MKSPSLMKLHKCRKKISTLLQNVIYQCLIDMKTNLLNFFLRIPKGDIMYACMIVSMILYDQFIYSLHCIAVLTRNRKKFKIF